MSKISQTTKGQDTVTFKRPPDYVGLIIEGEVCEVKETSFISVYNNDFYISDGVNNAKSYKSKESR